MLRQRLKRLQSCRQRVRVWIDGIVFNVVFGWVGAVVLDLVYNHLIRG
jgi:hypothetical protein